MNAKTFAARFRGKGAVGLALVLLAAGCVTPRIDWASRLGNYTFDQAVVEFGPPDKQAKLTDGSLVAEWLTRRGYTRTYGSFGYYPFYPGWGYAPFYPTYLDTYTSPDYYLRLVFGPNGTLSSWKRFAR